jgi:hypothetical protein
MALSVGFRITVSLLILLPKLWGSDSYPGGTDSHRTRQPSLDAQWLLLGGPDGLPALRCWLFMADGSPRSANGGAVQLPAVRGLTIAGRHLAACPHEWRERQETKAPAACVC